MDRSRNRGRLNDDPIDRIVRQFGAGGLTPYEFMRAVEDHVNEAMPRGEA